MDIATRQNSLNHSKEEFRYLRHYVTGLNSAQCRNLCRLYVEDPGNGAPATPGKDPGGNAFETLYYSSFI